MKKFPKFKEKFIERYSNLTDFKKFKEHSLKEQRKSIRVNTLKISIEEFKKKFKDLKLENVPWCKEGFFVKNNIIGLGNHFGHSMGYFYVQEASSMIPALVLDPKEDNLVLDIAAAPGSKTTQMASLMKNKGLIVANDLDYMRIKALNMNLQRCGVSNTIITQKEGMHFKGFKFDKILVDAPCSGVGTISKSPNTILEWNPNRVKSLSGIQKKLIETAFNNLKKDGTLVYSTCTLEPEENEGVIDYLLNKFSNARLEKIDIKIKSSSPILEFEGKEYNSEIKRCLRIWPQDNNTDGFFVAKISKIL